MSGYLISKVVSEIYSCKKGNCEFENCLYLSMMKWIVVFSVFVNGIYIVIERLIFDLYGE